MLTRRAKGYSSSSAVV